MIRKTLLSLLVFAAPLLKAQDVSTHIPERATYIVIIDPAAHVRNGDVSQVRNLEMFSRTNEFGYSSVNYLYGDRDLEKERQAAFQQFFGDIFSTTGATGVDTSRKIFIFNDETDSVHYWAYLLPLKNEKEFGDYISAKLFSKPQKADKGSGYSFIAADRMSVGWTNSYAVIMLSDFDFLPQHNSGYDVWSVAAMLRDSIAAAENYAAALAEANDTIINDSIRMARMMQLNNEADSMRSSLASDTIEEEDYDPYMWSGYGSDNSAYNLQLRKNDSMVYSYSAIALKNLINLAYEQSVESVANFRSVQSENVDAVYWYNYGELMRQRYIEQSRYRKMYFSYQGIDEDTASIVNMWKGSYVASLIRFEGNEATMDQRMYFTEALQAHTKGLYSGRVDKKMFRFVNGENLMGYMAMSVDMEKFMKFYGSVYREALENSMAGIYQTYYLMMWDLMRVFLNESTMYHLLDGKFVFAVTDLKPYTTSYVSYDYDENFNMTEVTKERTEIRPEFVFLAGIGKKKEAAQIIRILQGMNALKKQNADYYLINTPAELDVKLYLSIQNGVLIITDNEDLMVNHIRNGYRGKQAMKKSLRHLGRKSPLVGYWDGKRSISIIKKNESSELSQHDKESLDLLAQEVNSGTIIGRKSKKGVQRIEMKMTFNEGDKGQSSTGFVRFFRLLNSLFLIRSND